MKKRYIMILMLMLALVGLIFFAVKAFPKDGEHEGILVWEKQAEERIFV